MNNFTETPKKTHKKSGVLKVLGRITLGLLLLFFAIVLIVRSPWGQDIIVNKLVSYLSNKTNTEVQVESLYLTFGGNVKLNGLYLEDTKGDTLVYSKSLEANVPLWSIIRGQAIGVDALEWEGLRANIIRKDSISGYNFQFLLDAFSTSDTTTAPQNNQKPLAIILGDLNFKDFDVIFSDDVAGIESRFKIGELNTEMQETNLEQMIFSADDIELKDAFIQFYQTPAANNPDSEDTKLPQLSVSNLKLVNVKADYQSSESPLSAKLNIGDFLIELPKADLTTNTFEVNQMRLNHSTITLRTQAEDNIVQTTDSLNPKNSLIKWPDLALSVNNVELKNNAFNFYVNNTKTTPGTFNPNALSFNDLNVSANNISLKNRTAKIKIDNTSFHEAPGLNLKHLSLDLSASDQNLTIDNLTTAINQNSLKASLTLEYPSLSALINAPKTSKVNVNINHFQASTNDVFRFQPNLKNNPYLNTLGSQLVKGRLIASGQLSDISIDKLNAFWGNTTQLSANGNIKNITNPNKLEFNLPNFSLTTARKDITKFVNEKEMGIQFPERAKISGKLSGNINNINTQTVLNSSYGNIRVNGYLKNDDTLDFDASISIEQYNLNQLLKNDQLGPLSASIKAKGTGENLNTLNAHFNANVSAFQLNEYNVSGLNLDGNINNGKGMITSNYKDANLNIELHSQVVLDSVAPEIHSQLNVIGADLQALGLMQRNVKAGMKMNAHFKGNSKQYHAEALIDDGVMVYNNKTYLLGKLSANAFVKTDTTSVTLKNKVVDASLQSNTDPQTFSKALQRHIFSYFYRDTKVPDSITNPVKLNLRGHISQAPILNDLFFVNLKDLDTIAVTVSFNEAQRQLKANIMAPHINYSDMELDSLLFAMDTDKEKFNFNLGFNNIKAGPINIQKTEFKGIQNNNELALNFSAHHDQEQLMKISSKITGHRDELKFHVLPDSLVLNKHQWQVPKDNEIVLTKNKLNFNNFKFSRENQTIEFTDKLASNDKDHIAVNFNQFKLSAFLSYLNPDQKLATGNIDGNFILENPFSEAGIVANLKLSKFHVMDVNMGVLSIDAKSLGGTSYDFNANMGGGQIDFDIKGGYTSSQNDASLDLSLNINTFNMDALRGFSQGEITETNGSFSGRFKLSGSTKAPQYEGTLKFSNPNFKLTKLNANFSLPNETLNINNKGVSMENFTILDKNENSFVVSGNIGTASFLNPTFNLEATANNFQFLDATKEDNDFLYGKAGFDAEAKITGDLQIPKIDVELNVGAHTDATYVLPSATVNIEERDGVVQFVNRKNRDAILTRTEEKTATIKGFDIDALLKIGDEAAVTIIIDEQTGDNFKVSGTGDLNFTMNPNGNMTLSGIYEVKDGHYEMNLYNIVNRKFNLAPGSQVTWSGDPFDAKLDIQAVYMVEASASALMAPVFSNSDPTVKNKFRQVLPFQVYLNIDGELMQPKINFQLDMPKEEQGAIGGQVFGRVQQLNQQEDELNRQVFSLLVLNRFYPNPGSDGSSGGVASLARSILNDAVTDQLNIFSDKLLGNTGFELDFGFDSYTDYQGDTPEDRTQLDIAAQKKLFNDRLIVRVGSEVDIQGSSSTEEQTPLIGNVSLEYLLTENGRYKIKGFRRNEFENVIDGQTIVSGIALIYTQEFNKFRELWEALLRGKTKKEEQAEAEKEAAEKAQKAKEKATNKSMESKQN